MTDYSIMDISKMGGLKKKKKKKRKGKNKNLPP
jgi:hypothetical protein